MHAPTNEERKSRYWIRFPEWYSFSDDGVVFKDGTPADVLESFELYKRVG